MDRQLNKTLEISSRRASFFNFDKGSRLNRDRRPRVPASSLKTGKSDLVILGKQVNVILLFFENR